MKANIINHLIELVFTILTTVITAVLLPAFVAWLKSKTQNERIQAIISDISAAVATCVDYAEQTLVSSLKSNGEWNEETQADVLVTVVNNVSDILLDSTKQIIETNGIDLENLIVQHIEAYIQSKNAAAKLIQNTEKVSDTNENNSTEEN